MPFHYIDKNYNFAREDKIFYLTGIRSTSSMAIELAVVVSSTPSTSVASRIVDNLKASLTVLAFDATGAFGVLSAPVVRI